MKLSNFRTLGLSLLGVAMLAACGGKEVAPTVDSPYLGVWRGTTSAGDSLKFTIEGVQGKAMLTGYDVNVRVMLLGNELTTNQKGTNSNGYGEVIGNKVNFRIEPIEVEATFTSPTTLTGAYQGELAMGAPVKVEGTFTAVKK
jgi:hypothetical protein